MKLGGKISTSPRYVYDIPVQIRSLWRSWRGGRVNSKKIRKKEVFLAYEGVIGS